MASQKGDLEVVQLLLSYGVDVDTLDVDEETALHLAAYYGHPKVTELLLKHDANIYKRNKKDETPLDLASKEGHQDVANLLTVGFWEIVWGVVFTIVRLLFRL
jgi:ankyrin repeat protein